MVSSCILLALITVTNVVGQALSGQYVRSDSRSLTLRVGANERTLPFAVLKAGERERILAAYGALPPSAKERQVQERLEGQLAVIDAKERGGWLSKEAADALRAAERRNAEYRLKKIGKGTE